MNSSASIHPGTFSGRVVAFVFCLVARSIMLGALCPSAATAFTGVARMANRRVGLDTRLFVSQINTNRPSSSGVAEESSSGENLVQTLVVCGPSGVGKGTIISQYMNSEMGGADRFGFTVSHTTRAPREGEINGVHYHFTEYDWMEKDIRSGKFLEHANVHGNLYGTSFESMRYVQETLGKICLLDIDVQGVQNMKQQQTQERQASMTTTTQLDVRYLFIAPPSMEALRTRLENRGTETPESLERRTKNAQIEMDYGLAEGNFDYIVVNEDLDQACQDFHTAVQSLFPSP
eukprot:scaffold62527_cov49-Attheya_sp.AAC.4